MKHKAASANYDRRQEWNSHVRGAYIAIWLKGGSKLSTADIVRLTGMSKQGVEFMLDILCAYMPIMRIDGYWQWVGEDEEAPAQ